MQPSFKLFCLGLIAALLELAVSVHASADMYKGYEIPPYEVVATDGSFELRRYQPHLVAEVDVSGEREQAIRAGFRILADFIFGGNAEDQKVSMTVPVSQIPSDQSDWTVRFMMPESYTLETLPSPDSDAIRFVETAAESHLVLRFSGRPNATLLARKADMLTAYAKDRGHRVAGGVRYHFYDDPLTLPWNRRNEVSLPVS